MAAAGPGTYNVHLVPNADDLPGPPRPFPDPTFSPCTFQRRRLSDQHGSVREYEMVVETRSGRTWLFERRIMHALFGEVWRAAEVSITDGRYAMLYDNDGRTCRVAVKKMPKDKINRIASISAENPMNEFSALSIVSNPGHPNVQRLEAALDDGNVMYLISPFVDGGDIFEWISRCGGAYNEARTNIMRRLFRQLVHGMKYNHSKGICHADMSLENALVDMKRENACIIDYGKSFLMPVVNINGQYRRQKSRADGRKAKKSYRSPETFAERPYDGVKVDVFAAGAMLFKMLTGLPTFKIPTRSGIRRMAERLREIGFGNQAVDLLEKMVAYRPEDRLLPDEVVQHPWLTF